MVDPEGRYRAKWDMTSQTEYRRPLECLLYHSQDSRSTQHGARIIGGAPQSAVGCRITEQIRRVSQDRLGIGRGAWISKVTDEQRRHDRVTRIGVEYLDSES